MNFEADLGRTSRIALGIAIKRSISYVDMA